MICAWIETSSAETGSSAMISLGLTASARAMPMRWRWPPENSCGYRRRWSADNPTVSSSCTTRSSRARRLGASLWITSASPMSDPTVIRGLSEAYGSWKMICISFRRARSERLSSVVTFLFSNQTSPEVGSINRRMVRPVVDLPQPDSPTSPSVSPGMTSNDTSSTAWTRATSRESSPPRIGKYFLRFRTLRRGSAMGWTSVEEAGHLVAWPHFLERRCVVEVHGFGQRAAGREAAARPGVAAERRHRAGNRLQLLFLGGSDVDARDGAEQPLRVRVQRLLEQLAHRRFFDDLCAVHHAHALGGLRDDAHVVRDEHDGHAELGLQLVQQLEDLRLDGHVESGGRLVGDQEVGIARQRHGDHDALPHAARQLVRILLHAPLGVRDVHQLQHVDRLVHRVAAAEALVEPDGLGDLLAHREHRVQRRHRFLEDHRDLFAADH